MKVKYIKSLPGHHVGKIADIRKDSAHLLIRLGYAVEYTEPESADNSLLDADVNSEPKSKRGRKKKAD